MATTIDPSSNARSFHPSDASLRSTFHRNGTPAGQRSARGGGRARGGGFGEVKSPSIAASSSSVAVSSSVAGGATRNAVRGGWSDHEDMGGDRGAAEYKNVGQSRFNGEASNANAGSNANSSGSSSSRGGGGGGPRQKSLADHIRKQNSRVRKPYEMDIESADKDQPTWASRDWCAEARKSRAFLRGVEEGKKGGNDGNNYRESKDPGDESVMFDNRWDGAVNDAAAGGDTAGDYRRRSSSSRSYNGGGRGSKNDAGYHPARNEKNSDRSRNGGWGDDDGGGAERKGGYNNYGSDGHKRRSVDTTEDEYYRREEREKRHHDERRPFPSGGSVSRGRDQVKPELMERANSRPSQYRGQQHPKPQEEAQQANQHQRQPPCRYQSRGPSSNEDGRLTRSGTPGPGNREPRSRTPAPTSSGDAHPRQQQSQRQQQPHCARSLSRGQPDGRQPPRSGTPGPTLRDPHRASSRPQSRGPRAAADDCPRSGTPGPPGDQQHEQHSNSMARPRRKLGCLGGSSDMTHRMRLNNTVPPAEDRVNDMRAFEREMRHRRKHDRRGDLNNCKSKVGRRRDSDLSGSSGGDLDYAGDPSRGRQPCGRSQSRGQPRPQEAPEEEGQRPSRQQQRIPRDPSCSRSKSRSRLGDGNGGGDGRAVNDPAAAPRGSMQRPNRSLSRGKHSQGQQRPNGNGNGNHQGGASPNDRHRQSLSRRTKSKSPHPKSNINDAVANDSPSAKSPKNGGSKGSFTSRGRERLKKNVHSKSTVVSSHTSSTSSTPETGPLSSYSGKSSSKGSKGGGSLLKVSSTGSLLKHPSRGRMPPSTPPQEYKGDDVSSYGGSRPATPNRVPSVNGDASTVASGVSGGGGVDKEEIVTCMFDRRGYCVRHPRVRLRKKKLLGGWNVLITNCPDCCVEEMGRLKRVRKRMGKDKKSNSKKKDKKDKNKDKNQKQRAMSNISGREEQQHSRSRGRMPEVKNVPKIRSHSGKSRRSKSPGGRSSSRGGPRQEAPRVDHHSGDAALMFEFDINLDERGVVTSPRSVKTSKSHKSSSSKKSSKSARTNKSGKSTRTTKSSKSTRTSKSSKSRVRRSKKRDEVDGEQAVVSRGSHTGSSQRFIRQGGSLRVAKMPFTDKYKREGKYTGEINEHGQPHGRGTLRYNNGVVFEGLWEEGHSPDMDADMQKAKEGFVGNWKEGTPAARREREKRKEQDMDDLRSFISQSVRSGSVNGGGGGSLLRGNGSQYGGGAGNSIGKSSNNSRSTSRSRSNGRQNQGQRQEPSKERVCDMPWSDVNGFSGHYSGEVNVDHVPDGRGHMQYSNGVVEEGTFCNGVYQPPDDPPMCDVGDGPQGGGAPSSSMSVWSLKSSPTLAFAQGGHNVLTGRRPAGGAGIVMGAPTSVHVGGPSGGSMYGNLNDRRY